MQILSHVVEVAASLPNAVPDPGPGELPPGMDRLLDLMRWAKFIALGVCIIALFAAGAMLGFGGGGRESGEHAGRVGRVLAGVIVISAAAALVGFLAT